MKLDLQVLAYMRCNISATTEEVAGALGRSLKAIYLCLRRLVFQSKVERIGKTVNNVIRWKIVERFCA